MLTMVADNTRRTLSAVAAVAIVALAGVTLDQGHLSALPAGSVEVGELTPVNLTQLAAVTLPEIVVTGQRVDAGLRHASRPQQSSLPGLAVATGKALFETSDPVAAAPSSSVLLQ